VICTRDAIDHLAGRIERAYRRRNRRWIAPPVSGEVWEVAASRLLEASGGGLEIPIDPELFVAVLASGGTSPNPWTELTQRSSRVRYRKAVRLIIGQLRRELKAELQRARRRLSGDGDLEEFLDDPRVGISPLACYILAFRAGRHDLILEHRAAAQEQHRSCPLYRPASRPFLPSRAYPDPDLESHSPIIGQDELQFSLNRSTPPPAYGRPW
jgi:hypothetical protein